MKKYETLIVGSSIIRKIHCNHRRAAPTDMTHINP